MTSIQESNLIAYIKSMKHYSRLRLPKTDTYVGITYLDDVIKDLRLGRDRDEEITTLLSLKMREMRPINYSKYSYAQLLELKFRLTKAQNQYLKLEEIRALFQEREGKRLNQ